MEKIKVGTISFETNTDKSEQKNLKIKDYDNDNEVKKCDCKPCYKHDIYFEACDNIKSCNLGSRFVDDQGKILDLSLTLRDVCPLKRTAVAIALYEIGSCHSKQLIALKVKTIPASGATERQDICVDNIRFVIPDDTDTSTDGRRRFSVEVSANYIDVVSSDNCCSDK